MKEETKIVIYITASALLLVIALGFIFTKTRYNIVNDPRSTDEIIQELDPQTHCEEILGGTFKTVPGGSTICEINE